MVQLISKEPSYAYLVKISRKCVDTILLRVIRESVDKHLSKTVYV